MLVHMTQKREGASFIKEQNVKITAEAASNTISIETKTGKDKRCPPMLNMHASKANKTT